MDETRGIVEKAVADRCFQLAEEALETGEVPVGCVLVDGRGNQLASARNRANEDKNGCAHAEMLVVDQLVSSCELAGRSLASVMREATVWVTVEPCIMCARALRTLRCKKVVYGAKNERFGGCGTVLNVHDHPDIDEPVLECVAGVLDPDRAVDLLKRFYEAGNPNAPNPKRPRRDIDGHRLDQVNHVIGH